MDQGPTKFKCRLRVALLGGGLGMMIAFRGHALNDEFERVAIALDVGGAKMSADDQRRRIGKA